MPFELSCLVQTQFHEPFADTGLQKDVDESVDDKSTGSETELGI